MLICSYLSRIRLSNDSIEITTFQRWRWYLENFKDGEEKRVLLNADFEWTGASLSKDQFITKQMPYIMVGATEDINAINEKDKNTF